MSQATLGASVPPSMSAVPPSISVIITAFTFDRLPSIEETIDSLRSQTVAPLETLLVVDHAPELLEECKRRWPDVRVIANREGPGSCGGRNTGVADSKGEVVAFLDDDAVPGQDWIERLGSAYSDPRVLSVGGGVRPRWLTARPSWFPPEFDWIVGCAHSGMPKKLEPVRNVIIANMSVRRDAMIEVGGLRQEFSRIQKNAAGAEETDLCIRLNRRWPGGVVLFDPEAAVEHFVPEERTELRYFISRCFAEGRSKAALTRMVGPDSGLSAERSYVRHTLPLGVLRNLGRLARGDLTAGSRAVMIVAGLAVTVAGYLTTPRTRIDPENGGADDKPGNPVPPSPDFAPVRMDEVELSVPLPELPAGSSRFGAPFASSLCLVRLHGRPLGMIRVDIPAGGLPAEDLARRISAELGDRVSSHLLADGLPPAEVNRDGLEAPGTPACVAETERLLSDPPSVAVVICTRNRPESVRVTLRSILASDYPDERREVIVVDNAAEADPSIAVAAEEAGERVPVRVIHEPVPGLSNARNCGLRAADVEIIVFADDDVEVDRHWLKALVAPFRQDERVGATSGLTLPGAMDSPVQLWTEGFGGRVRPLDRRRFDLAEPPPDRPLFPFTVGEFGAGRNMAFRRKLLDRLGGFDPALGPGTIAHDGDDIETLLRLILAGHAVVHDPAAIVYHAHPDDYGELEDRVWGYGIGLTACLTKAVLDRPSLLIDLGRKLPRGIAFAISPSSEKNRGRQPDFPRSLARRELAGMAYGPIAYLRSRRASRRTRRPMTPSGEPPSRLRVLIVSDEYKPVIGGAARSAELLSHHMAGLGHQIAVATAWQPETAANEMDGPVEVHRLRDTTSHFPWLSEDPQRHHAPPFPDPEAVAGLRRLLEEFEPDLVHAYGWMANSTAAAMVGREIPLLISARDYGNVCANFTLVREGSLCSGPGPAKCLSCSAKTYGAAKGTVAAASVFGSRPLLRRKVTAVHSVSSFISGFMDTHLHVPGALSVTIPNFHEEETGDPDREILEKLPSEPFILFVGHLRGYKGIHQLLGAYERLLEPPPLVLVGTKGPDTPSEFPSGVTVLTYVPHATVMAMWDRALFGVFPSIAPEALGNVVHEAMSKGRATIGTRPGGHEDMIVEGETGLLVPGGDTDSLTTAMSRLLADSELREMLGRNARERAKIFTPEVVMPQLENLYYDTIRHFEQSRS